MILEAQVGPRLVREGSENALRSGLTGELITGDAHAKYHEAVSRGNVFFLSGAALAGTAYVGAGAGTPLLCAHNPTGSGKVLSLLAVGIALRAAATVANQTSLNVWAGTSVTPTGTTTTPRNAYSYQQSGAVALGFVNAALTGSTALNVTLPLFTYYWATAAGAITGPGFFDVDGLVLAIPGNQFAVGLSVIPTSTTVDVSMLWEEIPV